MNALVYQSDSREPLNRVRPARDGSMPAEPRGAVPPQRIEPTSSYRATTPSPPHANTWVRWFSHDAGSPDLVSFQFAFTVSMILMTGLTVIGWGITITSAWLTVVRFLITLLGCALYGWSLYDETFAGFRFKSACPAPLPARAFPCLNHFAPHFVANLRPTLTTARASQALNKNKGGAG